MVYDVVTKNIKNPLDKTPKEIYKLRGPLKYDEKILIFEDEINRVSQEELQQFLKKALDILPDYFWFAEHYNYYKDSNFIYDDEKQVCGIIAHTKRVIKLVDYLCNVYDATDILRDIMLIATILHEGWVRGEQNDAFNTGMVPFYQLYPRKVLSEHNYNLLIPEGAWRGIIETIEGHQGIYGPSPKLEPQKGNPAYLLHIADYLSNIKNIKIH